MTANSRAASEQNCAGLQALHLSEDGFRHYWENKSPLEEIALSTFTDVGLGYFELF
jgi:hypothetical protein